MLRARRGCEKLRAQSALLDASNQADFFPRAHKAKRPLALTFRDGNQPIHVMAGREESGVDGFVFFRVCICV